MKLTEAEGEAKDLMEVSIFFIFVFFLLTDKPMLVSSCRLELPLLHLFHYRLLPFFQHIAFAELLRV